MSDVKFDDLLMEVNRKSKTRRPMLVIKTDCYKTFLARLKQADHMPLQFRVFMAVTMCAGMRVSEGLSLRPANFVSKDTIKFKVSKKANDVYNKEGELLQAYGVERKVILHEVAIELLEEWKKEKKNTFHSIRHFGKLFSYSRNQIDNLCKKYFGELACHHSIARHSKISFLLFADEFKDQNMTTQKVAEILKIRPDTVTRYSHVDDDREWGIINKRMGKI